MYCSITSALHPGSWASMSGVMPDGLAFSTGCCHDSFETAVGATSAKAASLMASLTSSDSARMLRRTT